MKAVALMLFLVIACGDGAAPATVAPDADSVILTVERRGGLCPEGTCSSTFEVHGDGLVVVANDPPGLFDRPTTLAADQLEDLVTALDRGPGDLPAFTGTCPEAYDGPRFTYRFGDIVIDSCRHDVGGSSLIDLVHRVLELGEAY